MSGGCGNCCMKGEGRYYRAGGARAGALEATIGGARQSKGCRRCAPGQEYAGPSGKKRCHRYETIDKSKCPPLNDYIQFYKANFRRFADSGEYLNKNDKIDVPKIARAIAAEYKDYKSQF